MNPKKIVIVTGGAGFLGSTLVPELLRHDYRVMVIDNLSAGKLEHVPFSVRPIDMDIRDKENLINLFKFISQDAGGIHCVFHLAALPRVQFSIDRPMEAHSVNVEGLMNVFEAARKVKARRIVYSASSSAYGNQDTLPLHEGLVPNPMSPYAMQKLYGEYVAKNYALHYGLETVSLRYFNIYGPNFNPDGPYAQAIGKFLAMRKHGRPLTVTGDGSQTRDCVYATDVVRANILAAESDKVGKGEVINIGYGNNPTILEIARMIGDDIEFIAPRVEPKHTRADISRAKKLLGWEPQVSVAEGIDKLKDLYGIE